MTDIPYAALVRENQFLRKIVYAAMRCRRIGQLADAYEEDLEELWKKEPHMTKSRTGSFMYAQAYDTALRELDLAILDAADNKMDWAIEHKIKLTAETERLGGDDGER